VLLDSRLLRLSEDEAESEDVVRGALDLVAAGGGRLGGPADLPT